MIPRSEPTPLATPVAGTVLREVDTSLVDPNPRQPREVFDPDALEELRVSIEQVGLLQPIVVREKRDGRFELVMGERRLRASRLAGLAHVPALVRATDDDQMLRVALLENLHRADLNPLEEAAAYRQLLDDLGMTHDELAAQIGRSRSYVSNTLRLLQLPPAVQLRVAAGVLSAGHARALLAESDPERQETLAARIVAENLSVRAVEELVAVPEAPTKRPRQRRQGGHAHDERLDTWAQSLGDRFDTRVRIESGRKKGRLVVEFGSVDDLQRILDVMAPGMSAS